MAVQRPRRKRKKAFIDQEPAIELDDRSIVSTDVKKSIYLIQNIWKNCDDFKYYEINIQGVIAMVVFIKGIVNMDQFETGIMEPLTKFSETIVSIADLKMALSITPINEENDMNAINQAIADGNVILLVNGEKQALIIDISSLPTRAIDVPQVEPSTQGPQESFVENLEINFPLIRKRLRTPRLKSVSIRIGRITKTTLLVSHIEGVANPQIIDAVLGRIKQIDIDGILDTNYIREMILEQRYTPFRTSEVTERPDRTVAALLQGRIVIMVDGAPSAITVPMVFVSGLTSAEDYYNQYIVVAQLRFLRHITYWTSLLLPALYVALLSYHANLIPTPLLISLVTQHEGIPFPNVVEALLMQGAFEAIREAGVRLPKMVGQSVSIVGALIIGDAAVKASLVSPGMVIVVAAAGVASFTIPSQDLVNANRLLQFPFIIAASLLGLFGIITLGLVLVIHMVSLQSFGIPYMSPIAPFSSGALRDTLVRAPWWTMNGRQRMYRPLDNQRNQKPNPLQDYGQR